MNGLTRIDPKNVLKNYKKKVYFRPKKDSNYKITMTYGKEYVVEYELFQKIAKELFIESNGFITIYDSIVNRRYIREITPTNERTYNKRDKLTNYDPSKFRFNLKKIK